MTMSTRQATGQGVRTYKRWNSLSQEAKMIEAKLISGEIDPNESPKDIYSRYPEIQCFKLDSFRSGFNKMKTKLGSNVQRHGE